MRLWFFLSFFAFCISSAWANTPTQLESIKVFAGSEGELLQSSNPKKISKEKIQDKQFTDVTRALKQTSGVYVREEEGQGLRPNIGLRGTNPDRSKKIVLLQDGILIGPAPYSAPAAYYSPSMNQIEGIEVYKGFSAVLYGPNSIGGAINFSSPSFSKKTASLGSSFGSFGTSNLKATVGSSSSDLQTHLLGGRLASNGFKELDGGGDTGFVRNDVLAQAKWTLPFAEKNQSLLLRLGYADEDSKETYLGLSVEDFFAKSNRRYVSSSKDEMQWDHGKIQLEHSWEKNSSALKTTLYRHQFERTWYRLDRFRTATAPTLQRILKDPYGSNLPFYQILKGERDSSTLGGTNGQLQIARNNRRYLSQGIQTKWLQGYEFSEDNAEKPFLGDFEFFVRLHNDWIERNHTLDAYDMDAGKMLLRESSIPETKNRDSALAGTVAIQNNLQWGKFSHTINARAENVAFENTNQLTNQGRKREDRVFVPGTGVSYLLHPNVSVRTSFNKAVTVAGLDAAGGEKREESNNYEMGFKYANSNWYQAADLTFFRNDYQNLTGTCTTSTGCASNQLDLQFNGGQARIDGLEAQLAQGISVGKVWIPIQFNATWMSARFRNSFASSSPEWGVGQVLTGDPLPYVPFFQYTLSIGTEWKKWKQEFTFLYQTKMRDQSVAAGRAEVPAFGIVDWSSKFSVSSQFELFAKADNLLGKNYISSLRPFGARPGKPRAFQVGLSYTL